MENLTELEKESRELLSAVKKKADAEDMSMSLPELPQLPESEFAENGPQFFKRRIPSWVAIAAMVTGIAIGIVLPRHQASDFDFGNKSAFNYADTCRSIAQDDVNLSLLVTSLDMNTKTNKL